MDLKFILTSLCIQLLSYSCKCGDEGLSNFHELKYNYLFTEIINNSIYCDTIFIKDLDFSNEGMLLRIQEFALCYVRTHPKVTILRFSYKNKYPIDEFKGEYVKITTYLKRHGNETLIQDIHFLEKRKEIHIKFPVFSGQPDCD